MSKVEIINNLQRGDNILIKYDEDWNSLSVVISVFEQVIVFKDSSGLFEFTKKYLLNSDLELELIEED